MAGITSYGSGWSNDDTDEAKSRPRSQFKFSVALRPRRPYGPLRTRPGRSGPERPPRLSHSTRTLQAKKKVSKLTWCLMSTKTGSLIMGGGGGL